MSFALTTEQIRNQTKTVTRRVGWTFLKPGDLIQAIEKGQGLKKGEKVTRLGVLRVLSVRGEWMSDFCSRPDAAVECGREGFPEMTPQEFYTFFRGSHADPSSDDLRVTRIEFSYEEPLSVAAVGSGRGERHGPTTREKESSSSQNLGPQDDQP